MALYHNKSLILLKQIQYKMKNKLLLQIFMYVITLFNLCIFSFIYIKDPLDKQVKPFNIFFLLIIAISIVFLNRWFKKLILSNILVIISILYYFLI